jgi:hypothetical protein
VTVFKDIVDILICLKDSNGPIFWLYLGAVHNQRKSELELLIKHFTTERYTLTKHVDRHQAQGLAVHQETVAIDGGEVVNFRHVTNPILDIFSQPRAWVWLKSSFQQGYFVILKSGDDFLPNGRFSSSKLCVRLDKFRSIFSSESERNDLP